MLCIKAFPCRHSGEKVEYDNKCLIVTYTSHFLVSLRYTKT